MNDFEIQPLGDRVIVLPNKNTESVRNGIIIPEMAKERPLEGVVIAVGETASKLNPCDQILYGKYAGAEIKINDVPYLIMNQEDVIGIRRKVAGTLCSGNESWSITEQTTANGH